MTLAYTLKNQRFGNFTYLQWLIIIFAFVCVMFVVNWLINESTKPPPVTYEGQADGAFHARRYFFCAACTPPELQKQNCYNNSYLYFYNGQITLSDGKVIIVGEEGREVKGNICLEYVDSYISFSSDKSHRTPVRFRFTGVVSDMPVLEPSALVPWVGWGATICLLIYALYRKVRRPEFDALSAKKVFKEYVDANDYKGIGRMEAQPDEVLGGKQYTVSQLMDGGNKSPWKLILKIDNHKRIHMDRSDETGNVYRYHMGKDAVEWGRQMAAQGNKYSEEEVYDSATKMLQDYFDSKDKKKARTPAEKQAEVFRLRGRQQPQDMPAFGPVENEEEG